MPRPRACRPPTTIRVKGHWRRRKRRKPTRRKPTGRYYVVTDGSSTCGHHHKRLTAATQCRRAHERRERAYRARYGKKAGKRRTWYVDPRGR